MVRPTVVLSNRTQAVRRPNAVACPESVTDVRAPRDGASRVITPANASWDDLFDAPGVDLWSREQPSAQARDAI